MASFGSQFRGIQFTMVFVVSQLGVRLATLHLQPESRGREREVGGGGLVGILLSLFHAAWGLSPWDGSFLPLVKPFWGQTLRCASMMILNLPS